MTRRIASSRYSHESSFVLSAWFAVVAAGAALLWSGTASALGGVPIPETFTVGTVSGNPVTVCSSTKASPPSDGYSAGLTVTGVTESGNILTGGTVCGTITFPVGFYGTFYIGNTPSSGTYPIFTGTYVPIVGYVDPKFIVLGVTYAPPGPSANTFVSYSTAGSFSSTSSIMSSFTNSASDSVEISAGLSVVYGGSVTSTTTTTVSQKQSSSTSATLTYQAQEAEKTYGTDNYFKPVNHDYDILWVWLNPAVTFMVNGSALVWTGYAYDASDTAGMDVVPLYLGYLNGDIAIPPDIQASINRSWASTQIYSSGNSAALNASDMAAIAGYDPFSVASYGVAYFGTGAPPATTSDGRFALSTCSSAASFYYLQAAPNTTADVYSCSLSSSTQSSSTQVNVYTDSVAYSMSAEVSVSFEKVFNTSIKATDSQTLTWETQTTTGTSSSSTSTAALSVQGPPCTVASGVCSPAYDADGTEPVQFEIYTDNVFGTFMFQPVAYSGPYFGPY